MISSRGLVAITSKQCRNRGQALLLRRPAVSAASSYSARGSARGENNEDTKKKNENLYRIPTVSVRGLSSTSDDSSASSRVRRVVVAAEQRMREGAERMREGAERVREGAAEHIREGAERVRDELDHRQAEQQTNTMMIQQQPSYSIRGMLKQYGPLFVATYASLYFATIGTFFVGIDSGAFDPASLFWGGGGDDASHSTVQYVAHLMDNFSWTQPYSYVLEENPRAANLAVAWVATKVTEPVRFALTLVVVPRMAERFGFVRKPQIESNKDGDS